MKALRAALFCYMEPVAWPACDGTRACGWKNVGAPARTPSLIMGNKEQGNPRSRDGGKGMKTWSRWPHSTGPLSRPPEAEQRLMGRWMIDTCWSLQCIMGINCRDEGRLDACVYVGWNKSNFNHSKLDNLVELEIGFWKGISFLAQLLISRLL